MGALCHDPVPAWLPDPVHLLLALIAGVTELIPYLGPVLGAVPGVLTGLLISLTTAIAMLAVYMIVQQVENYLLVPRIIGTSIVIHSFSARTGLGCRQQIAAACAQVACALPAEGYSFVALSRYPRLPNRLAGLEYFTTTRGSSTRCSTARCGPT